MTGDKRDLLGLKLHEGTKIVTVRDFLTLHRLALGLDIVDAADAVLMVAAKNSRNRRAAVSPASGITRGATMPSRVVAARALSD